MWTHLQPYLDDTRTAENVRRLARIGLWRSVNLGRLIVLAGSGVTRAYGQQSWNDILASFVAITLKEYASWQGHSAKRQGEGKSSKDKGVNLVRVDRSIKNLHRQILELVDVDEEKLSGLGDENPPGSEDADAKKLKAMESALEAIRERFKAFDQHPAQELIESSDVLVREIERAEIASGTGLSGSSPIFEELKERLGAVGSRTLETVIELCEELLQEIDKTDLDADVFSKVRRHFAAEFEPLQQSLDQSQKGLPAAIEHPVEAIIKYTRSLRVLTTNYDLEFERWYLLQKSQLTRKEAWLRSNDGTSEVQTDLIDNMRRLAGTTQATRRLEIGTPLGRPVVSNSLDVSNVGDLLNFAAYSRNFDLQVFHLHGRLDFPQEMVVTQNDYRRIYAQDILSEQAFRSAQEVLFSGNDVLMLGFGLSEEDLLRPFRQFVGRGRDGRHAPRRTFALMATNTGKDHKRSNNEAVVKFAQNYEIYTVHYGGPVYRSLVEPLKQLSKVFKAKTFEPEQAKKHALKLQEALEQNKDRENHPLVAAPIPVDIEEILGDILSGESNDNSGIAKQKKAIGDKVDKLLSGIQSRALAWELKDQARKSAHWWDAWRQSPHERRARYHIAGKAVAGEDDYLYVRHRIDKPFLVQSVATQVPRPEIWPNLVRARDLVRQLKERPVTARAASGYPDGSSKPRKRQLILRLTSSRGGGKSTLVDLLHHRTNQAFVFGRKQENYRAAFIAHLSFSMEFTSVIKALTRFIARQVALIIDEGCPQDLDPDLMRQTRHRTPEQELVVNYWTQQNSWFHELKYFSECAEHNALVLERYVDYLAILRRIPLKRLDAMAADFNLVDFATRLLTPRAPTEFATFCKELGRESDPILRKLARELAISQWEDDQRFLGIKERRALPGSLDNSRDIPHHTPREHRLDVLRKMIAIYQTLEKDKEDGTDKRLFLCLSGLDRVVSPAGDAFNPVHRAFFRLISGNEENHVPQRQKEAIHLRPAELDAARDPLAYWATVEIDPPFDMVLVAGHPDAPICYLSEDVTLHKDKIPAGQMQKYSSLSATGRYLKKWHELEPLDWHSRLRIIAPGFLENTTNWDEALKRAATDENAYRWTPNMDVLREDRPNERKMPDEEYAERMQAAASFIHWAETTDSARTHRNLSEHHSSQAIHRLLWEYTCLSLWVMTAWIQPKDNPAPRKTQDLHSYLRRLDGAAARNDVNGVIEEVLAGYRKVDRVSSDYLVEFHRQIMRHLVLFALPVEANVLLLCPEIHKLLDKWYREVFEIPGFADIINEPPPSTADLQTQKREYLAKADWHKRNWMLLKLKKGLNVLSERGLVMSVLPAADETDQPSSSPKEQFLHRRYSLHGLMRRHLAYKMALPIHDGADLNHHRMSIYSDQPRDLPSPTMEHYGLVKAIFDNNIRQTRETLWALYRHSREQHFVREYMRSWDPEEPDVRAEEAANRALARRVFAPQVDGDPANSFDGVSVRPAYAEEADEDIENWMDPNGLAGSLGRIHSVPQSLRAMFSLVQGAFSIGSLSRLSGDLDPEETEKPFDAYRSWLRSLLSAGTSLDRLQHEVSDLFYERLLPVSNDGQVADTTEWLVEASTMLEPLPEERSRFFFRKLCGSVKSDEDNIRKGRDAINFKDRQRTTFRTLRHPFFRDEIAWLYNERGLAALTQGLLFDAIPLFERASFVMSHRRTPELDTNAYHAAERRIQLNYAIAQIERGNIARARFILEDLKTSSVDIKRSTPSEIMLHARLYSALCDHLSGGLVKAHSEYEEVIRAFADKKKLRAEAVANRFLGDLFRAQGNLTRAEEQADTAVSTASRAEQRDVQHLALITKGRILTEQEDFMRAGPILERALQYGEQMGLMSTVVDAKNALAVLTLRRGDLGLAAQYSSEAIALAVRHGLRLRKLAGLVCFAQTRQARGSADFSTRLLQQVIREAETLGYLTIASRAVDLMANDVHLNSD